MRKLLTFRLLGVKEVVYIFSDKIIAARKWGEGIRIFTDNECFDVANSLKEVLEGLSRKEV